MARQKEISLCSDNDASDDEVQQDHLEERANDEIVHNNETNKEQREEDPAEEVTDWTEDTDIGISWDYSAERDNNNVENMSRDYSEKRDADNEDDDDSDNNNQVTRPTNTVAPHRKALPFANLLSANSPPKIHTDYVADPAIPRATLWLTNHTTTRVMSI